MEKCNLRLLLIAGLLLIFLQQNAPTFAGEKAPFRPDPARGSIGIEVKTLGVFSEPRSWAYEVYFLRIDSQGDDEERQSLLISNFQLYGQVYLLNVEPGRYVAVGARIVDVKWPIGSIKVPPPISFPDELVAQTEVTVDAGKLTFIGKFVGKPQKVKSLKEPPTPREMHFFELVGEETSSPKKIFLLKRIHASPHDEFMFWTKAKDKTFRNDPEWLALVEDAAGRGN
jgi:hypothetical protein